MLARKFRALPAYILRAAKVTYTQLVNSPKIYCAISPAIVCAGLTISLPILVPYHNYPLLTFYSEWAAFLLGLLTAAILFLGQRQKPAALPWIALALIGFCVLLYGQMLSGMIAYPQRSVMGVMYAFWAALMAWTGATLRERFGMERISLALAGFVAAGAWMLAITGFMQYFQIETMFGRFVEGARQVGMYGVIAQRNLFANYVACGLVATAFLFMRGRISILMALLLGLPLVVALAYAGSRSAWIYAAIVLAAAAWNWKRGRDDDGLRGLTFSIVAVFIFVLVRAGPAGDAVPRGPEDIAPWEWLPYRGDDFTQVPIAPRLLLAWHAWIQFVSHPILGVGYGEYPWNLFQNAPLLDGHLTPGIDRHAHNIALHLLAETGLAGFAIIGAGFSAWLLGLRRERNSAADIWIVSVIAVQLAHSMVEFPLWYSPFLGMTALFMGISSSGGLAFGLGRLGRGMTWAIVIVGLIVSGLFFKGYRDYEKWYLATVAVEVAGKLDPSRQIGALLDLKYSWMFSPYFDLVGVEIIAINRDELDVKLALNSQAMRLFPIPSAVSRQALLLAVAGRDAEAWEYWRRLRIVYPYYESGYRNRLFDLARDDPGIARLADRLRAAGGKL